jgi:hypothetical protein
MIPADGSVTSEKLDTDIEIVGQLTAPNQTATTSESVLTKKLASRLYPLNFALDTVFINPDQGWTSVLGTGGASNASANTIGVQTGTTIGNQVSIRTSGYSPHTYNYANQAYNAGIDWTKPIMLSFKFSWSYGSNEGLPIGPIGYIGFGRLGSDVTYGPITLRGIGIIIKDRGVYGMVHDGNSLSETPTEIYSLVGWPYRTVNMQIISDGQGNVDFIVNRILVATLSNGPSTQLTSDVNTGTYMAVGGTTETKSFTITVFQGFVFSYLD